MNEPRVKKEIQTLNDGLNNTVSYDLEDRTIIVKDFPLPDRCQPETTTVKINVPDAYPHRIPTLYISDRIQVDGETPMPLWEDDVNGWFLYDLHWLKDIWVPERNTWRTLLRFFRTSLKYPQLTKP